MTSEHKRIRLVRLAHVYYTHRDLAAATQFLRDFGFQECAPVSSKTGPKTIFYHGTDTKQPFVYCAREGPEDAFGGAAFVVESREDLEYAAKTLPGATGIIDLDQEERDVPGGGLRVTFTDPIDGFPFHLVWGQRGLEGPGDEGSLPALQYNLVCSFILISAFMFDQTRRKELTVN